MKKTLTLLVAILITTIVSQLYAQSACCTASGGKNRTICCPGAQVMLNGSGTCNCTDTLPDSTILHCNTILYRWIPTSTLNNPNIAHPIASPTVTTTYTLTTYCIDTVHNDTCCQASSTVTVFVNSTCCRQGGMQESSSGDIIMYPNPATKTVNLKITEQMTVGEVVIYDNLGRLVLAQAIGGKEEVVAIDISSLPSGSYQLQVKSDETILFSDVLLVE